MQPLTAGSIVLFSVIHSGALFAQSNAGAALASWVALDAPTGHEHWATAALQNAHGGWQPDRFGNLVKTVGDGSPHRVVACALDSYAYSISQITDEGYLRVHRIGNGSTHPLWDQAHEGQQLRIVTDSGPQIVVSAVANGHFAAQHRSETALITQNDLWLDAGVDSAKEVAELGISLLDPVLRNLPAWTYGDEVAGPRAGARASCAAVFSAAEAGLNGPQGSTSYVLSVQQVFGWTGMTAALRWLPNVAVAESMGIPFQLGHTQGGTDGTRFTFFGAPNAGLSWPGRYSHSPAEISDLRDIAGLVSLIKAMTLAPLELEP